MILLRYLVLFSFWLLWVVLFPVWIPIFFQIEHELPTWSWEISQPFYFLNTPIFWSRGYFSHEDWVWILISLIFWLGWLIIEFFAMKWIRSQPPKTTGAP